MPEIPDKAIDMILTDLPYGITNNNWDSIIDLEDLWGNYKRIIKDNGAIVLTASQPFTTTLISSNKEMFRYSLVWKKNKASDFLNARVKPLKIHEDILVFYKKSPVYNPQYTYSSPYERWNTQEAVDKQTNYGEHSANIAKSLDGKRYPTTVVEISRKERPSHPTEKPVALMEWLIQTYTNEKDLVLDSCIGTGATAVACILTNRNFIGIELNSSYVEIAEKRLSLDLSEERIEAIEQKKKRSDQQTLFY